MTIIVYSSSSISLHSYINFYDARTGLKECSRWRNNDRDFMRYGDGYSIIFIIWKFLDIYFYGQITL